MFDLKIAGGRIVDGSGAAPFIGDVAIKDGLIAAVRPGSIEGGATEVLDGAGLTVTPGFVDVHTHYDGQVSWDSLLDPSSGHGVTTVVMGNCGVGFAPVAPGSESWLIGLMEGVEDIPGSALSEGRAVLHRQGDGGGGEVGVRAGARRGGGRGSARPEGRDGLDEPAGG